MPNAHNEQQWCREGERPRPLKKKARTAHAVHTYGCLCVHGMVGPFTIEGNVDSHRYIRHVLPKMWAGTQALFDANNDTRRWCLQQGVCVFVC